MLIRDVPGAELARRLAGEGIHLDTGAFTTHLRIRLPHLVGEFAAMYADYPIEDPPGIDDARVTVVPAPGWRKRFHPEAIGWAADLHFGPVPAPRAYVIMETALNWAAAATVVAPLLIHSAVLERDGRALLMPAPSGSGKSTLCAALAWRGWRLLSDEVAAFSFDDGSVRANPRPVSLKNRAIEILRAFEPDARFSTIYRETAKGDIAYMHAPASAIARAHEPAMPGLVVIPAYRDGAPLEIRALEKAEAFRKLTENSVNYPSMLQTGFDMLVGVVERCGLYALVYSDLDEAVAAIDRLHRAGPAPGGRA